jgi:hypothetical protein
MSKGNTGNQPERKLEAEAKQALQTSVYTYIEHIEPQFTNVIFYLAIKPVC